MSASNKNERLIPQDDLAGRLRDEILGELGKFFLTQDNTDGLEDSIKPRGYVDFLIGNENEGFHFPPSSSDLCDLATTSGYAINSVLLNQRLSTIGIFKEIPADDCKFTRQYVRPKFDNLRSSLNKESLENIKITYDCVNVSKLYVDSISGDLNKRRLWDAVELLTYILTAQPGEIFDAEIASFEPLIRGLLSDRTDGLAEYPTPPPLMIHRWIVPLYAGSAFEGVIFAYSEAKHDSSDKCALTSGHLSLGVLRILFDAAMKYQVHRMPVFNARKPSRGAQNIWIPQLVSGLIKMANKRYDGFDLVEKWLTSGNRSHLLTLIRKAIPEPPSKTFHTDLAEWIESFQEFRNLQKRSDILDTVKNEWSPNPKP